MKKCLVLLAFGRPVATCCNMLDCVGSSLKMAKFLLQHFLDVIRCCSLFGQRKVSPSIAGYVRENIDFHLPAKTCDTYLGFTDESSVFWHCMIFFGLVHG